MSNIIQQTTQFEPIEISISMSRKGLRPDGSGLLSFSNYTFSINTNGLNPNSTISTSPTFLNSYFVPVYNSNQPNYTTIKFEASLYSSNLLNYPVQLQWDFGDGRKILIATKENLNDQLNTRTGQCSVVDDLIGTIGGTYRTAWNNELGQVTYTTTGGHNLSVGSIVHISGVEPYQYNGTFTVVSTPTSNTFVLGGFTRDFGSSLVSGTYKSLVFNPVYHKYPYGGPRVGSENLARNVPVTLSVIDNVGRKVIVSKML